MTSLSRVGVFVLMVVIATPAFGEGLRESAAAAFTPVQASQANETVTLETMRSEKLFMVGLITAGVGVYTLLPKGTRYDIFGESVCVTDYSVDYGDCSYDRTVRQIGMIAVLSGVTMMIIGGHHVTVTTTRARASATMTVGW